jgi:large subunit ribosomal protein L25
MDSLKVEKREITGKKVESLRQEDKVPAVVYGAETENINLTIDYVTFEKLYAKAGESTLINLKLDGTEEMPVLIHDVFRNPVSDKIDHVDFYKIKYGQKLTATVELEFIGEPKAVKELGGVLVTNMAEVEIECLPKDLISKIKVDLSNLKTFEDYIHVKDLKVPETVKILTVEGDVVANVSRPRVEEEKPVVAEEAVAEEAKEGDEKEEAKEEQKEEVKK